MKKILLLLLIITFGLEGKSQEWFCLGPKIGYNSNTLSGNFNTISSEVKNSLQVGAFIRVGSKVYIQPEANYQVLSGTLNSSNSSSSMLGQDYSIQSLKIPALLGFKLLNKSAVNFRLMAGPAVTYLFNKKIDPVTENELWPLKSASDLKNSVWSVQTGVGLDVLFLTLDVRYEFGVENMYSGNSNFKMRNNMFNVSLGFKLL
jgi:hypothetical protein